MLAVKMLGIVFVVVSCSVFGFLKSYSLTARHKKLCLVYDGVIALYDYIQNSGCELDFAIENSFSKCNFLSFNGKFCCEDKDLKSEDKTLVFDFFTGLGKSVKKVECEKIENFKIKLQQIIKTAQSDVTQKAKIYQSFGICIGITIGILLI